MKTCCSLKKCKKTERKRKKEVEAKVLLASTGIKLLCLQNILIIISLFWHISWIWNKELFKYFCVALV